MSAVNKYAAVAALFAMGWLSGCNSLVSPSRIPSADLQKKTDVLQKLHKSEIGAKENVMVIGHGAGSFRYYPMRPASNKKDKGVEGNNWVFHPAEADKVSTLITRAFEEYELDAVEIDVQVPAEKISAGTSDGGESAKAFVMHDSPDWDAVVKQDSTWAYMQENSLEAVLADFVKQEYHLNKVLYLELKSPRECQVKALTEACRHYVDTVVDIISPYLSASYAKDQLWLRLVSFSPYMLSAAYAGLDDTEKTRVGFEFIAGYSKDWLWGSNGIKAALAQTKGDVPEFDSSMKKFITESIFINRVWFSVKGMRDPRKEFIDVVESREKSGASIEMSVAVYDVGGGRYRSKLSGSGLPITSILIDIDEPRDQD